MASQKQEIAIITGANSGLGLVLTKDLLQLGYQVYGLDLQDEQLLQLQEEYSVLNIKKMDVSKVENWEDLVQELEDSQQEISLLINCAGFSITAEATDIGVENWQKIINVNLLGAILGSTLILGQMKKQGSGMIVNIASMFGLLPAPSGIAYATTKHGLVGFSRTLAVEAKDFGVDLMLVCPGFLQTKFFENAEYIGVEKEKMVGQLDSSLMSPQEASRRIVQGIQNRKKILVFPFYVRFLWWLDFLFPWLARKIWEGEMRKYRKL